MEFFGDVPTYQTRIVSKLFINLIKQHLIPFCIDVVFSRISRVGLAIITRIQSQNDFHTIAFSSFKHFIDDVTLHLYPGQISVLIERYIGFIMITGKLLRILNNPRINTHFFTISKLLIPIFILIRIFIQLNKNT